MAVFWILIFLDDVFMLTVDLKRTYTFIGSVATQTGLNLFFLACIILYAIPQGRGYWDYHFFGTTILVVSAILVVAVWFFSVGLLIISLRPIFMFRTLVPMRHLWKANTKDALNGSVPPLSNHQTLTFLGSPRRSTVKTYCARPSLRGSRPAETRMYAFARNIFAVAAIFALIFRAVTALLTAQNEVGTRPKTEACTNRASKLHSIGILMERPTEYYVPGVGPQVIDANITVSASWSNKVGRNYQSYGEVTCTVQWSRRNKYHPYDALELYICNNTWTDKLGNYNRFNRDRYLGEEIWDQMFLYHISVQRALDGQMPYIWLLNTNELPSNLSQAHVDEVRSYLPPWELLHGAHIEAEAKLITRRFIKSSIMRDVLLHAEPEYRPLSLYPITESSVALNIIDRDIATATVRTSLTPGLMSLRKQADTKADWYEEGTFTYVSGNVCDFIDDYRSGTVLDVLGSVGGLFALLQALHVLLFGRPLLWGLTGAKLISPFGLFGKCSSKEFKRRLREEYHGAPTEDGLETIRVGKFLRDFVIEFGPADLDPESHPSQQPARLSHEDTIGDKDAVNFQVPLMQAHTDPASLPHQANDIEGQTYPNSNRGHIVD
ncbi:NAD(P)H-quinone oxidoreductase subunit 5, chloroplastic [Rhizoctonia solani]|uniref:NAD(P)H-quinone oxidoreductase subunit 5, chloroplastic n=1 Tax=Rhizoctonia solani TaxID=456999 RepID=A0A0K6G8Q2_9AGAM|nr:NAD(P)H-quinone oxidoreductase subunit 5, chloroplastic [Rhizoctonia solani]